MGARNKVSKIDQVKKWLEEGNIITKKGSVIMFGYDRLSDGIYKLRNRGMDITTKMVKTKDRFGNDVTIATYFKNKSN